MDFLNDDDDDDGSPSPQTKTSTSKELETAASSIVPGSTLESASTKRVRFNEDVAQGEGVDSADARDSTAATNDEGQRESDAEKEVDEDDLLLGDSEEDENLLMAALLEVFPPEMLKRYEHYRRSHFKRLEVRRVMIRALGLREGEPIAEGGSKLARGGWTPSRLAKRNEISDRTLVLMGGAAKIFAGDVIEAARLVMTERNETGSIEPRHLMEAIRVMGRQGRLPILASMDDE